MDEIKDNDNSSNKKDNLLEIIADAILHDGLTTPIRIPDVIEQFYSTINVHLDDLRRNVNVKWESLKKSHIFEGGFFFHDIDNVKFCIHQKLSKVRYAIIGRYLNIDHIEEYLPKYHENNLIDKVDALECKSINLSQMRHDPRDFNVRLIRKTGKQSKNATDSANLYLVFRDTLLILNRRHWISNIQYNALELQFEIKFSLRKVYKKWLFIDDFRRFKKEGIPNIDDLTAQCLYWECSQLICLNPHNIYPDICKLFNGPLFHFFCYLQLDVDKKGNIK